MKLKNPFKRRGTSSRTDRHKNSVMVRMLIGDYKAVKVVAKSRHMPAIRLLHQFVVMGCSAAIYEDIMKHEQRRKLVIALCQGAGIKASSLDKLIPEEESPGESSGTATP